MKIKSINLILTGFIFTGISVCKAEAPVSSCGDDSSSNSNYSSLSTLTIPGLKPAFPVNENEVKAGLLYDAVSGKIVWQKNINTAYPIASLTKMMVALLAVEDVRAGKFSWEDNVKWTRQTIVGRRLHSRKVYSEVNYSLRDVFKAAMIASNNECAEQMARYLSGGDLQQTIDRMNTRAKELNMMNTFYGNPTGLPAPHLMFDNSSTPSDLLILTLEMLKYNEVIEIASMGYASIENGKFSSVISNHNHLTIEYSGEVDGLKTGYTRRAGFCLVATSSKCDYRLVSIVLGCRGPQIRNDVVRDMFNDYYTCVGQDKLGPLCPSPMATANNQIQDVTGNGHYVTVNEKVIRIHVVKNGENLSTIASRYGCSTSQLKSWNNNSIHNSRILKGQRLMVYVQQPKNIFVKDPVNGDELNDDKLLITDEEKKDIDKEAQQADETSSTVETVVNSKPEKYIYHVVAPGDTLFSIAKRYDGITVEQLKSLNKITNSRSLKPGTKIKVKVQG